MREIPNDILANLLRYLPMLIENLDLEGQEKPTAHKRRASY